ncbi:MAG: fibronectin type III domain-containing protein [Candidatus Hydrogenedentes bacterium]|nr:fibronectin type III domain-containing protein [Candidatus Hydrogenedentota bacterium]
MPCFPKKEADIFALANQMIAGYTDHPAVFPHADVAALTDARINYTNQVIVAGCYKADVALATEVKDKSFRALVRNMKQQLKRSESDTKDNPLQLKHIGWTEERYGGQTRKPAQPRSFEATPRGPGVVELEWKAPAPGKGGPVRSYVVLRRQQLPGQKFTHWSQEGMALTPEITLTNQPRYIQLEYRIIAINATGTSVPSNAVAVVL